MKQLVPIVTATAILICTVGGCRYGGSAELGREVAEIGPLNIILIIGDGMGPNHRLAASLSLAGHAGGLRMDDMPIAASVRTASLSGPITDSAAAATAIATGIKTLNGVVGLDGSFESTLSILEQAKQRGMAVGLVTTTQITHATPAAFAAEVESRYNMAEIASQMIAADVDVLLGGGENTFLPYSTAGFHPHSGTRDDGRNLVEEARTLGYSTVHDAATLQATDPTFDGHLLGLFADEGMIRPFSPTLAEMVKRALSVLSQDPDGFFLMFEGGQIDWASHANDAENMIADVLALDDAVAVAQSFAASHPNTLLIVLADHETGGMELTLESSGLAGEDGPFPMPDGTPFYVNWGGGGHSAVNVPLTAQGPGSELIPVELDNTVVHDIMLSALSTRAYAGRWVQ